MPRFRRFAPVLAIAVLSFSCSKLFPPPLRPSTDGYRARLLTQIGSKKLEAKIAVRGDRQRKDVGNPGTQRSLILRADKGELWELDERLKRASLKPARQGESVWDSNGFYPLVPTRPESFDLERYAALFPEHRVTKKPLSDSGIGLHPCDVLRVDRIRWDGQGVSETWYFARDLDGLVLKREVQAIVDSRWGPDLELNDLVDVTVGAPAELFEIPEGWTIVKEAVPTAPKG